MHELQESEGLGRFAYWLSKGFVIPLKKQGVQSGTKPVDVLDEFLAQAYPYEYLQSVGILSSAMNVDEVYAGQNENGGLLYLTGSNGHSIESLAYEQSSIRTYVTWRSSKSNGQVFTVRPEISTFLSGVDERSVNSISNYAHLTGQSTFADLPRLEEEFYKLMDVLS